MAFGKPILAMVNGEGENVISESNSGFVCHAGDFKQLASNVRTAFEMPKDELAKLGVNGQQYYRKNYSKQKLLDGFEQLLLNDCHT